MASEPAGRAARLRASFGTVPPHQRRATVLSGSAATEPAAVARDVAPPPVARTGRAVAYIPAGVDRQAWAPTIEAAARRRGLVVTTLARRWVDVEAVLRLDPHLTVILGCRSHLPPERIVFADDDQPPAGGRRGRRLSRPPERAHA